jgi:hypothetical protein
MIKAHRTFIANSAVFTLLVYEWLANDTLHFMGLRNQVIQGYSFLLSCLTLSYQRITGVSYGGPDSKVEGQNREENISKY